MRRLHGLYRAIGLAGQVKSDRHMLCVPEEGKNAAQPGFGRGFRLLSRFVSQMLILPPFTVFFSG